MNCSNCGSEIKNGASFCTNCGAKVEVQPVSGEKFCTQCGTKNAPDAKFCDGCGKPLDGVVQNYRRPPKKPTVNKNIFAIAIAGLALLIVVIAVIFGMRACGSSKLSPKKAEKIVQNFFDELIDLNVNKAMEYVSEEEREYGELSKLADVDDIKRLYDEFGKGVIKFDVDVDDETFVLNNNTASVEMEIEMKINSSIFKKEAKSIARFGFIKQDGKWLINSMDIIRDFGW